MTKHLEIISFLNCDSNCDLGCPDREPDEIEQEFIARRTKLAASFVGVDDMLERKTLSKTVAGTARERYQQNVGVLTQGGQPNFFKYVLWFGPSDER